jgi:hypothetical protein
MKTLKPMESIMPTQNLFLSLTGVAALTSMLFSLSLNASTVNVDVQCDVEGPVYGGSLVIPDAANFACGKLDGGWVAVTNAKQPNALLTFNNLSYKIFPGSSADVAYSNEKDCAAALKSGQVVTQAYGENESIALPSYESQSGLGENATFVFNNDGTFNNGTISRCSYMAR